MNMYGYIYLTVNKVNHKTYIGQKKLGNKSWDSDQYIGSGKHLKCAIKKYGKENFEKFLIQFCKTPDELDKQEIFWIAEYRKRGLAQYNITAGGSGFRGIIPWNKGKKMNKDFCEKTRIGHLGHCPWNKGKKAPTEVCKKLSDAHTKTYIRCIENGFIYSAREWCKRGYQGARLVAKRINKQCKGLHFIYI